MPEWPKNKLLTHGSELPMPSRIRRYQESIKTNLVSGCKVPSSAMVDTLAPAEKELWFADNPSKFNQLNALVGKMANLPPDT